jgi:hypothetical protein
MNANTTLGHLRNHVGLLAMENEQDIVHMKANGEKYAQEWLLYSPSTGTVY